MHAPTTTKSATTINSHEFWAKVSKIVRVNKPFVNTDKLILSKVYWLILEAVCKVNEFMYLKLANSKEIATTVQWYYRMKSIQSNFSI